MKLQLFALAIPALAVGAFAQGGVIPDGHDTKDANYRQWAFSRYGPSKYQVIYNASLMKNAPLAVTKISWRRDGSYKSTSFPNGPKHDFIQKVSMATKGVPSADHMGFLFSMNRGTNFTEVFKQKKVTWPLVKNDGIPTPKVFEVVLPLDRPIVKAKADNLCMEIETNTPDKKYVSHNIWYVDAQNLTPTGGTSGTITFPSGKIGCNGTNNAYASHYASPANYTARPGAMMRLYMWRISLKAKAAISFLGTPLAKSVPLDAIGMKGCNLHINPLISVPMFLGNPSGTSATSYNRAYGHLLLPNSKAIEGAVLAMQSLIVDPGANSANLVMSNMSTVKLGSALPATGYRQCFSIYSYGSGAEAGEKVLAWDHGRFYANYAPVMKIN